MRFGRREPGGRIAAATSGALLLFGLAACGSDESDAGLSVSDAWVKASDGGMTAAFGVLTNDSGGEVVVVGAETSASERTELHEVVTTDGEMVMQQKEGGFAVPADGEHTLEPGADHIMILDLASPVEPGDEVTITLSLDGGATYEYSAQAKETEGGEEPYHEGDMSSGEMSTDSMSPDESGAE